VDLMSDISGNVTYDNLPDALALLDDYARSWSGKRAAEIAGHWDPARFIFYKAEEVDVFFQDWDQLMDYWKNNEALHDSISLRFSDLHLKPLAEGLAVASVRMRWDIRFAENARLPDGSAFQHRGKAMGGDNHVVVFFCGGGERWKICGWSETPDAAIAYVRSLYFKNFDSAGAGPGTK
jgi:hypothetical protein